MYRRKGSKRASSSKRSARAVGYGRKRHNTIVQSARVLGSKTHTGIFAPETFTTLATVDSGGDRLWVLGTLGGMAAKIAVNPTDAADTVGAGYWKQLDPTAAGGIERHKLCPLGVYRLNCVRDFVHSSPIGWDVGCAGALTDLTTDSNVGQGYINGQKTFDVIEIDVGDQPLSKKGWFKPTYRADNRSAFTTDMGVSGPMVVRGGLLPQGYTKLASVYARNIVYNAKVDFSLINVGPIASQKSFENSVGQRTYGFLGGYTNTSTTNANANLIATHNEMAQSDRESATLYTPGLNPWYPDGPQRVGRGEAEEAGDGTKEVPVGDGGIYLNVDQNQGAADPKLMIGQTENMPRAFGDFAIRAFDNAHNNGNGPQYIHLTGLPNRCAPKYIWFGVTVRKNYVGGSEDKMVVQTGYNNAEYPSRIPKNIDEANLDESTKLLLVNISENAQAATISLDVDVAKWLGVPSLQDALHGYFTAKPGGPVTSATSRQLYPVQGLYAIPWIAPTINHYGLAKQAIGGACPFMNRALPPFLRAQQKKVQHEHQLLGPGLAADQGNGFSQAEAIEVWGKQSSNIRSRGVLLKDQKLTEITGYSNFFCLHSKITWNSKFYSQRVMDLATAPLAWGGGVGAADQLVGFGETNLQEKYV